MVAFRMVISMVIALLLSVISFGCSGKTSAPKHAAAGDTTQHSEGTNGVAGTSTSLRLSYEQRQGRHLYGKYCSVCHGDDGKGSGFNAYNLDPKPRDFTDAKYMNALTDDRLMQTIEGGGRSVNRSSLMPSWGGRMQKEEIKFVLSYIRTFAVTE